MSATDLVQLEDRGEYAMLTINRAEKRNAMSAAARLSMRARLEETHGKFKVIVLTGTEGSFCSGVDLKEQAALDCRQKKDESSREWIDVLLAIRRHPSIFISAVNGFALGGGVSLINVCDLAIAADEAEIGMPEIGFATYPAMAGPSTQMMLSAKRAAWLVLTTKRLNGKTAEQWGLVNLSVPLPQLEEEVARLATHITQFDATTLTESKRALETVPHRISDFSGAFDYGQLVNATIRAKSAASQEGLARFSRGEANPGQGSFS